MSAPPSRRSGGGRPAGSMAVSAAAPSAAAARAPSAASWTRRSAAPVHHPATAARGPRNPDSAAAPASWSIPRSSLRTLRDQPLLVVGVLAALFGGKWLAAEIGLL